MRRLPLSALLLLLAALLAGYGAAAEATTAPASRSLDRNDPGAVNAAWVEAVRGNDQAAASALYDAGSPEVNAYNVKHALEVMGARVGAVSSWGRFQGVEQVMVQDNGAAKLAYSRWIFDKKAVCYYAALSLIGGTWIVTDWQKTDDDACAS